ncbi:MAG: TIGR03435 family protein [Bryobacteraceae bacterium]
MHRHAALLAAVALAATAAPRAPAQSQAAAPAFEVATVQLSDPMAARSGKAGITIDPRRLSARRVSLKELIFEAYNVPYYQISGGPSWLDSEEYDIDAKAESPAGRDQMRLMLRTLLADRFKLAIHRESKEMRVYALTVGKNGPLIHAIKDGETAPTEQFQAGVQHYHGDMPQFAGLLSIWLSIPILEDPSTPSRSNGPLIPVLDKTGLKGTYNIDIDVKPEPDGDSITAWQRALQQQLGLKLEAQKAPIEIIVIDHAEKTPARN